MITLNFPQGSTEWITARLWRLTASEMKTNITSTGKLSRSEAAMKSIDKLIAGIELANVMLSRRAEIDDMDEWQLKRFMSHYTGEKFSGSTHTIRGHECEPDAIAMLSEKLGCHIHDVGMCVMGDNANGVVSCSPDGLIYNSMKKVIKGVEIKSPCLCNYYQHVEEGVFPDDYALQVHSSMAICDVDAWHFGSYFTGKPLFHVEVKRSALTDQVQASLVEFKSLYQDRFESVTAKVEALKASEKEAA